MVKQESPGFPSQPEQHQIFIKSIIGLAPGRVTPPSSVQPLATKRFASGINVIELFSSSPAWGKAIVHGKNCTPVYCFLVTPVACTKNIMEP